MDKIEFTNEVKYLKETIDLLKEKVFESERLSNSFSSKLEEGNLEYLSGMRDMNLNNMNDDTMLELSFRQNSLEYLKNEMQNASKELKIYSSMQSNPYFAKITILPEDSKINENYYIGVHSLMNNNEYKIIDWRSPIAEVFYNHEVGKAYIKTNTNLFYCELKNKRQFKITDGKLDYYFDTNLTINDDILKDVLGQSKSGGMKSIVQTIQKEQNNIIRKDEYKSLLVNGVAGSGKTAIALHRVAYLLYKLKGKLQSNEVMLLTPNEAFSNYISTVLPELSEDDVLKMQFDSILKMRMSKKIHFEKRFQQFERLILKQGYIDEYKIKYSKDFCDKLVGFCNGLKNTFIAKDVVINDINISHIDINNMFYDTYSHLDIFTKICYITDKIISDNFYFLKNKLKLKMLKQQLFTSLYDMFEDKNVFSLYTKFLKSHGLKFSLINNVLKNEDASAIFLIKSTLFGYPNFNHIKHLVVDEVQDYSCVQLYIISQLFKCPKTILGDVQQSLVSEFVDQNFKNISNILGEDVTSLELKTSYRPTRQIAELYNFVNKNNSKDVLLRDGEPADFIEINNEGFKQVLDVVNDLKKNGFASIAIITKTNKQAKMLYENLNDSNIQLISNNFDLIIKDVVVLSAFNSKGMEFDAVICYDVSDNQFVSEYDNKLLFIMISRALHKVVVLHKSLPKILNDYVNNAK